MAAQAQFQARKSFVVPVTNGNFAPETILFAALTAVLSPALLGVTVLIEALPAAASIVIELLKVGGDPTADADWFAYKAITVSDTYPLAGYAGVRIRAKSGGTAGTATVSASAD